MNKNSLISGLTPLDNVNIDAYYEPLVEGINDRNITNIAISGSLGSGKSSIIKSFEKKCLSESKKFNFLNISLADFENSDTNEENSSIKVRNFEIEENIERSILQKMFYTVSGEEIPFSRFRRIKNISKDNIYQYSLEFTGWALVFSILFFNDKLPTYFNTEVVKVASFFIIFYGVFKFFPIVIKSLNKLNIASLDFLGSKVDFGNEKKASILNKNIDEIIYFFKVTEYNVMVFEDLDRYKSDLTIYKKLREINIILNGSKEIKDKNITFIYAIRDDYFNKENRSKFFDLILPVIPVVDYTNASDKISEKLKVYNITYNENINFSDDFIADMGLFLPNMRLISNVFIEFIVYSKIIKINKMKDIDKNNMYQQLFCLLTYKTLYPDDFANLLIKKGILYNRLQQKMNAISKLTEILENRISEIETLIDEINKEYANDIIDIRNIFLGHFLSQITSFSGNNIHINDKWMTIDQIVNEDNFDQIKSLKPLHGKLSFSQIKDSNTKTYDERVNLYKEGKKITLEKNKNKIEELQDLKRKVKYFSFDELINELTKLENKKYYTGDIKNTITCNELLKGYSSDSSEVEEFKDFITLIITQKYIDVETYELFISHFYEENLNSSDRHFIINIKNSQGNLGYDYELNNLNEITRRLSLTLFNRESILNFNLFKYVYENKVIDFEKYQAILENIIDTKNIEFIDLFLVNNPALENDLLKDIIEYKNSKINDEINKEKYWYWDSLNDSKFTLEKKYKFIRYLLKYYQNLKDLKNIQSLKNFLSDKDNQFIHIVKDLTYEKIIDIIKDMDLFFDNLIKYEERIDVFKYIYTMHLYSLKSREVLLGILKKFNDNESCIAQIENAIVSSIQNSTAKHLIDYFENNPEELIDIILEKSTEEDSTSIIYVLNLKNEIISKENKYNFLKQQKNKVEFTSEIQNDYLDNIFELNKVEALWVNVVYYMNTTNNIDILVSFINKNYEDLINDLDINDDSVKLISEKYLFNKLLNIEPFKKLVEYFKEIDLDELEGMLNEFQTLDKFGFSNEKLEYLLGENLINFSEQNYNYLMKLGDNLHISLIENFTNDFENIEQSDIDIPKVFDIKSLLILIDRNKLSITALRNILSVTDIENISNNEDDVIKLVENIIEKEIIISTSLFYKLYNSLTNNKDIRIKFLVSENAKIINNDIFIELIEKLGDEYKTLVQKNGKKPRLENTQYNNLLEEELIRRDFIYRVSKYHKNENELVFYLK